MEKELYTKQQDKVSSDFERQYIDVREKEQRIYTDEQVSGLPFVDGRHPHSNEWKCRKRSAERLINYLKQKAKYLRILEVGCGNGWLSAMMAGALQADVTGIDVNIVELEQAIRVFQMKNLSFLSGDIENGVLKGSKFDIIVFAASIQYFPSLTDVLNTSLSLLSIGGEIHILDSHFYNAAAQEAASQRTQEYYTSLGFPQMSAYYHHHSLEELQNFDPVIMYKPHTFVNRLLRKNDPFYWLSIKP